MINDDQAAAGPHPEGPRGGRPCPIAPSPAPPRDARDVKCAYCNEPGHSALQCTRPKLSLEERRCHVCNKVGHAARRCPDASKPTNESANSVGEREKEAFVIRSDEYGFQSVRPGRCAISRQGFSLGDMPITNRSGSHRERRAGRYDALSSATTVVTSRPS